MFHLKNAYPTRMFFMTLSFTGNEIGRVGALRPKPALRYHPSKLTSTSPTRISSFFLNRYGRTSRIYPDIQVTSYPEISTLERIGRAIQGHEDLQNQPSINPSSGTTPCPPSQSNNNTAGRPNIDYHRIEDYVQPTIF